MNGLPVHISSRKDMRSWSIITGVRPERLIAREAGYLVFCEVKYRASDKKGHPAEAVNPAKQRTISKSALCYMAVNGIDEVPCRFDVVSIENHEVTLYRNAFDYTG